MKYTGILILWFSFLTAVCFAQAQPADSLARLQTLKKQAGAMVEFFVKKDFKAFTKFTHPKILEMLGGEQKMIEALENVSEEMKSEGAEFLNATIGEPSGIFTVKNELQCTVPETIELKVTNGRLVTKSTLIAISVDNGKNWFFIDTSGKDIETMRKVLPNLSGELVLPSKEKPIFYEG